MTRQVMSMVQTKLGKHLREIIVTGFALILPFRDRSSCEGILVYARHVAIPGNRGKFKLTIKRRHILETSRVALGSREFLHVLD